MGNGHEYERLDAHRVRGRVPNLLPKRILARLLRLFINTGIEMSIIVPCPKDIYCHPHRKSCFSSSSSENYGLWGLHVLGRRYGLMPSLKYFQLKTEIALLRSCFAHSQLHFLKCPQRKLTYAAWVNSRRKIHWNPNVS